MTEAIGLKPGVLQGILGASILENRRVYMDIGSEIFSVGSF